MKNNQKSSKISQKKQQEIQTPDSGRSMVEMLGTLAVIGVLSITGIMGYNYAMKKYRSNQIANELSVLSNQIFLTMSMPHHGEYELSLGSPYDEGTLALSDYTFDFGCGSDSTVDIPCSADEYVYYMTLENIPNELCSTLAQTTQHLPNLVEQQVNGEIDITGSNCGVSTTSNALTLFFEIKDLEKEPIIITSETVQEEDIINTQDSPITTTVSVSETLSKNVTNIWTTTTSGTIVTTTTRQMKCESNSDCFQNDGKIYYCWAQSESAYSHPNGSEEIITFSECREAKIETPTQTIEWTLSKDGMTWWSAQRFCAAIKRYTMPTLNDFNCTNPELIHGENYCYDPAKNIDADSQLAMKMFKAYNKYARVWTADEFDDRRIRTVSLGLSPQVGASYKSDDYGYAMCK